MLSLKQNHFRSKGKGKKIKGWKNIFYAKSLYGEILFSYVQEWGIGIHWINLEHIILSERSQTQRLYIVWFPLHEI